MTISCNALIESTLANFVIGSEVIDIAFMDYQGHNDNYIVYREIHKDRSYNAEDVTAAYFSNIDFDVYSKKNYLPIIVELISRLEAAGFNYQPDMDSNDLYDADTKFYHKTICMGYPVQLVRTEASNTPETPSTPTENVDAGETTTNEEVNNNEQDD